MRKTLLFKDKARLLPVIGVLAAFVSGCSDKPDNGRRDEAKELYRLTAEVVRLYTDSIGHATDSAALHRMSAGVNERLTKVNYMFAPDTYLHMDEEENDSIIHMMERLERLISRKRVEMERTDSVQPSDSTSISQSAQLK